MEHDGRALSHDLMRAVEDADMVAFEETLKKRTDYLESITEEALKKELLLYFIQTDKELTTLLETKKNGFKDLLLTQNNQLKAVKKYDIF